MDKKDAFFQMSSLIVGGGSQVDRLLLELEDWITGGQVSAGAGTEARGDWIRGKCKEVVEF